MIDLMAYTKVPLPPASLLHRIKFVEDHIIQLEREYPPWAALHFNQPRRGVSQINTNSFSAWNSD